MVPKSGGTKRYLKVGKISAKDDIRTVQNKKDHNETIRQIEALKWLHEK